MYEIRPAELPRDLAAVRLMFREYAAALGVDLAFQDFEAELASLPGKYAPPSGRLLLAWDASEMVGCVALRPLQGTECEMKRLYLKPAARGEHLGRRLAQAVCQEARVAGYTRICLDTLPSMAAAHRLYAALGFQPIGSYGFNPLPGTVFLALDL